MIRHAPSSTLFPYTTLFRSHLAAMWNDAPTAKLIEDIKEKGPRLGPQNAQIRSEEHTSELQSRGHLVCRLLLEKKKRKVRPFRSKPQMLIWCVDARSRILPA